MKKLFSLVLALAMAVLCVAGAYAETVELKVWGSQEDQELIAELCAAYAAEHPENEYNFTFGVVGEADAKARYLEDPAAAADVFSYPDDQIIDLVNADALYEVTRNHDAIVEANSTGSVNAASVNGVLYGYPMTADNGYFLYYDKSVISDEDAKSFDTLLAAAAKAGKRVQIDISNGWYLAGFFLGNGCVIGLDENGKQVCDFNSEKGLAAAEAIRAICNDPAYMSGDDAILQGGMGDEICAGVSGTWVSAAIKEKLGDNYGAAKLPTFTVNGEQVQMGSFLGCKIVGVNTQTANPVEAMNLAEYLTSEQAQIRRYEVRGYGPSNVKAAASETITADVALSALAAQSEFGVSQHVLGAFWTPAEAFGAELEAHTEADLQTLLDAFVAQVVAE